jgi:hypothetical protein
MTEEKNERGLRCADIWQARVGERPSNCPPASLALNQFGKGIIGYLWRTFACQLRRERNGR